MKVKMHNTAFRQKVIEKRQPTVVFFLCYFFGNYPPVSEAKLYCEHKSRDVCRVIVSLFTVATNSRFIAILLF